MKTLFLLLLSSAWPIFAQTSPATTQLREPTKLPICLSAYIAGLPICVTLAPSVTLTQVNGVWVIAAVPPAVTPPTLPTFVYGESSVAPTPQTSPQTFLLTNTPIAGTVQVYRNGVRQLAGTDYTISGANVTFIVQTSGPALGPGDLIVFDYQH